MNSNALQNLTFIPLSLGKIKPLGWLKSQLRLQADGLSGHLDEFWPDIQGSRWFGGETEGWSAPLTGWTASSRWPFCWMTRRSKPKCTVM